MMSSAESEDVEPPILDTTVVSESTVLQTWVTLEQMYEAFQSILLSEKIPTNFMECLGESIGVGGSGTNKRLSALKLRYDLRTICILFNLNDDSNLFSQPWTLEDVKNAVAKIESCGTHHRNNSPFNRSNSGNFQFNTTSKSKSVPKEKAKRNSKKKDKNAAATSPNPKLRKSPCEFLVNHEWEPLIGNSIRMVRSSDFLQVKGIIPRPKISDSAKEDETKFMTLVLPYILQKIKMIGANCIESNNLIRLITAQDRSPEESKKVENSTPSQPPQAYNPFKAASSSVAVPKPAPRVKGKESNQIVSQQNKEKRFPISRLDLLVTILSVVDGPLASDICRILGQFSIALPLIMPSMNRNATEPFTLTIPFLENITVKRGTSTDEIFENHLFKSPFRLVVCVRLGTNGSLGKSSILNNLMQSSYMFSSTQEPGADRSVPCSLHGSVEFTWLTVENCKDVLWDKLNRLFDKDNQIFKDNEILLLANLHGNAVDFPETVRALSSFKGCSFLSFIMPTEATIMNETCTKFLELIGPVPYSYLMIDPHRLEDERRSQPEEIAIDTTNLKFSTLEKVALKLRECYLAGKPSDNFNIDSIPLGESLKLSPKLETDESQQIINFVVSRSCAEVKELLKLQKCTSATMKDYEAIWENEIDLRALIQMLVEVLELPLRQRQAALIHLDREISKISGAASRETRMQLVSLKEQRSNFIKSIPQDETKTNNQLIKIDQHISEVSDQLEKNNLGVEHLFREIGRLYDIALHNTEDTYSSIVLGMAPRMAEMMLEGQVIELFDGDAGRLSGAWMNAVAHEVCKLRPRLKVFVITILGVQSSGKSTLLNALFGCKFSVSAGRCTRGLFMRLLFLDDEFKKSLGFDAILLLDTEGLCAPEKMRDPKAEEKDRQMATFAMSISHLTIVNVMGEAMSTLADILQIVVITLARLEKVELTPDILLVQHGSEVDKSKLIAATTEFCRAIKEAIEVTEKQFTTLGILNSACLKTLCRRVENYEILKLFHPYKNGATANASPSQAYHEDVVDLYNKIVKVMGDHSTSNVDFDFHKWHTLLSSCWNAVDVQNFSLRFRNIQEIYEFIDRGTRIAHVNEAVQEAFGYHRGLLQIYIRNQIFNLDKDSSSSNKSIFIAKVETKIDEKLTETLEHCVSMIRQSSDGESSDSPVVQCNRCYVATTRISDLVKYIQGKVYEEEVTQTINSHINCVREHTKEQLKATLLSEFAQKHQSEDVDKILHQIIQSHASDGQNYNKSDGKQRALIIDTILDKLAEKLSSAQHNTTFTLDNMRDKIFEETLQVYSQTPIADPKNQERLKAGHALPDLRNLVAFPSDIGGKLTGVFQRGFGALVITKLNMKHAGWLEHKLYQIPNKIFADLDSGVNTFQIGMIAKLQKKVIEILAELADRCGLLIETFRWEVHFYAIKEFSNQMEIKHFQESVKTHRFILSQKADLYRKKIDACLSHGFSYESEGRILAECFLRALRQKAKKAGDERRKQELLHQSWLTSTENVRLCFFEKLAAEVQRGDFENALEYFSNPKKCITSWFVKKVDSFDIHEAQISAMETFNAEVERIWAKLQASKSFQDVRNFANEYFAEVEGIQYSNEVDFATASIKQFKLFRTTLYETIRDKSQENFNSIVFKSCSDHNAVKDRLGCTEYCFWCGALCWGHAGHELNKDSTRKHHTCHQPQGLIGVFDESSGQLLSTTCDSIQDDMVMVKAGLGAKSEGMTWAKIRQSKEFDNWIFIRHSVDDFNNLMGWFFVKLNKEIASRAELLPCDEKTLKGIGLALLDSKLHNIMSVIKQKLV